MSVSGARLGCCAALLLAAARAAAAPAPALPTVAVLYFDYQGPDEQLAVLRKGLAQMISADLVGLEQVTVVERDRLQEVLAELDLQHTSRIDPSTAVRVGKLLGARYLVFGSYFQLGAGLSASSRLVETETGRVLYALNASGPPGDFLAVEQKLSSGLAGFLATRLPPLPPAPAGAAGAPAAPAVQKARARKPPRKLDTATALTYSQALDAKDRNDKATAVAKLQDVLARESDFPLAADDLARLSTN
ncbi:MAG: CsgG/HfaB family protein [Anaeromyxobacter sp.]